MKRVPVTPDWIRLSGDRLLSAFALRAKTPSKLHRPAFAVALLAPIAAAQSAPASASGQNAAASSHDRWLHVRVTNPGKNEETVRVNLPLELAEKVLPTINKNRLHSGKVSFDDIDCHGVDLHALLDAVRTSKRVLLEARGRTEAERWEIQDTHLSRFFGTSTSRELTRDVVSDISG